jgi:hypothetical protein
MKFMKKNYTFLRFATAIILAVLFYPATILAQVHIAVQVLDEDGKGVPHLNCIFVFKSTTAQSYSAQKTDSEGKFARTWLASRFVTNPGSVTLALWNCNGEFVDTTISY